MSDVTDADIETGSRCYDAIARIPDEMARREVALYMRDHRIAAERAAVERVVRMLRLSSRVVGGKDRKPRSLVYRDLANCIEAGLMPTNQQMDQMAADLIEREGAR